MGLGTQKEKDAILGEYTKTSSYFSDVLFLKNKLWFFWNG